MFKRPVVKGQEESAVGDLRMVVGAGGGRVALAERLRGGVEVASPTDWGILRSGISWEDLRVSYAMGSMAGA